MMEKKKTKEEKPETLPAEVRANMLSTERSIFFNVALFEQAQRVAKMFADSTMVPNHFRNNIGNCMIALNYASRIEADPFMVFQSLYEVHGRPGIEGKLVEAIINASNKYSEPLQYEWLDPEDKIVARHIVLNHKEFKAFGCQAFSIDAKSGKRVDGPKITWELVKAEGWYDKQGSKWQTMAEMMFYYRAASWFGNKNCPELKLGMHTVEELEDIIELRARQNGSYGTVDLATLNEKLKQPTSTDEQKSDIYKAQEVKAKPEKKAEPSSFVQQFINLKKGDAVKIGFVPTIMKKKSEILAAAPEDQEIIRKKFYTLYGPEVSYPLDPPGEKKIEETETEDKAAPSPKADEGTDQQRMLRLADGAELVDFAGEKMVIVKCPIRDDKPTEKWCSRCNDREGCDTWKKYDAQVG